MQLNYALPLVGWFLLLSLTFSLVACGGGSSSIVSTNPSPPPAPTPEYIYASGGSTVMELGVNTSTGALTAITTVPGANGGVDLVATPSARFLYATDDTAIGIDGFSINNGVPSPINGSPFPLPVNLTFPLIGGLAVDSGGRFLYAADPASDVIAGFVIDNSTGAVNPISGGPFTTGTGTSPEQVVVDPSSKFLYVTDQLDNQGGISGFTVNSTTGALTPIAGSPFPTFSNSQPQGIAVHPTGKFVYAALSNSNSIAGFAINSTTGALAMVPGSPFAIESIQFTQSYWISMHPSGKFLYTFNLIDGTVSGFTIDSNSGALTSVAGSPFASQSLPGLPGSRADQGPLRVDPSGKFLYTASPNFLIAAYKIDGTTGALTPVTGSPFPIPDSVSGFIVVQAP